MSHASENHDESESLATSQVQLAAQGIYTYSTLSQLALEQPQWCVEQVIATGSTNVLVGDSGLGKTPLMVQLGVAVASGKPFLGRPTKQSRVLFCDYESSAHLFHRMLMSISEHVGLSEPPPNFFAWSPNWKAETGDLFRTFQTV